MLEEMAYADAYGVGFEFTDASQMALHDPKRFGWRYVRHPKYPLKPGYYTDDTQMSVANCEVLLSGDYRCEKAFADAWVNAFKRDERPGYAGRFYDFLQSVQSGDEFLEKIQPHSERNGAAMRALPLGLLSDPVDVMDVAGRRAAITHDTPVGRASAIAVALMAHYLYHRVGPKFEMAVWITDKVEGPWRIPWDGRTPVSVNGVATAHAAIQLVATFDSYSAILEEAVGLGGDTDSVAAIACGAASLSPEFTMDIPRELKVGLENGAYGRDSLIGLDRKIFEKFPRKRRV
jgi:ADP-ribosylglycohydrolase